MPQGLICKTGTRLIKSAWDPECACEYSTVQPNGSVTHSGLYHYQTGCYASLLSQTRTTSAGNFTLSQTIFIASKKIHTSITAVMTNGTKNHTAIYIYFILILFVCVCAGVKVWQWTQRRWVKNVITIFYFFLVWDLLIQLIIVYNMDGNSKVLLLYVCWK